MSVLLGFISRALAKSCPLKQRLDLACWFLILHCWPFIHFASGFPLSKRTLSQPSKRQLVSSVISGFLGCQLWKEEEWRSWASEEGIESARSGPLGGQGSKATVWTAGKFAGARSPKEHFSFHCTCGQHQVLWHSHFDLRKTLLVNRQESALLPSQSLPWLMYSTVTCPRRLEEPSEVSWGKWPAQGHHVALLTVYKSFHFFLMLISQAIIDFLKLKWRTVNVRLLLGHICIFCSNTRVSEAERSWSCEAFCCHLMYNRDVEVRVIMLLFWGDTF